MAHDPVQFGDYLLLSRIAAGGMAEIYRAQIVGMGGFRRDVAIKRILPQHCDDQAFVNMLLDEARIAARLDHANIVQVINCGCIDDVYFIAMDFVEGQSLRSFAEALEEREEKLPPWVWIHVGIELLRGLDYAHKKKDDENKVIGIVHRDVSPHNTLVSYEGQIKLTDFGIAKAADRLHHTETGVVKGKLSYMAPEQFRGGDVDHRVDQFAAALVIFEFLSGRSAFKGDSKPELMRSAFECRLVDVKAELGPIELADEFAAVLLKALSPGPAQRYADCGEFADALTPLLQGHTATEAAGELASRVGSAFAEEREETQTNLQRLFTRLKSDEYVVPEFVNPIKQQPIAVSDADVSVVGESGDENEATRQIDIVPISDGKSSMARNPAILIAAAGIGIAGLALAWNIISTPARQDPPVAVQQLAQPNADTQAATASKQAVAKTGPSKDTAENQGTKPTPEKKTPRTKKRSKTNSRGATAKQSKKNGGKVTATPVEKPAAATAQKAAISVVCLPWCEITIDGKRLAKNSPLRDFSIAAGDHVVSVTNPATGISKSKNITLAAGDSKRLSFRLR